MASARLTGFEPRVDKTCRAVVLGSFPGVASLQAGEYYAHPRNLFWAFMSEALNTDLTALPFASRYALMLKHRIGLWDVFETCERHGSLDQAIKGERAAQLDLLTDIAPGLEILLLNGRKAQLGARKALSAASLQRLELIDLPSTSPANASISRVQKQRAWSAALNSAVGAPLRRS